MLQTRGHSGMLVLQRPKVSGKPQCLSRNAVHPQHVEMIALGGPCAGLPYALRIQLGDAFVANGIVLGPAGPKML